MTSPRSCQCWYQPKATKLVLLPAGTAGGEEPCPDRSRSCCGSALVAFYSSGGGRSLPKRGMLTKLWLNSSVRLPVHPLISTLPAPCRGGQESPRQPRRGTRSSGAGRDAQGGQARARPGARRSGAAGGRAAPGNGSGKGKGNGNGNGKGKGKVKGNGKGKGKGNGNGKGKGKGKGNGNGSVPLRARPRWALAAPHRDGKGVPPQDSHIAGNPPEGRSGIAQPCCRTPPSDGLPREAWLPPDAATYISVRKSSFALACVHPGHKLRAVPPAVPGTVCLHSPAPALPPPGRTRPRKASSAECCCEKFSCCRFSTSKHAKELSSA